MISVDEFLRIVNIIRGAKGHQELFGIPTGASDSEKLSDLKQSYRKLALLIHPDHAPKGYEKDASEAFIVLNEMFLRAEKSLGGGDKVSSPSPKDTDESVLSSNVASYRLGKTALWEGDLSNYYSADIISDAGKKVILKIAKSPLYNTLLENEAKILGRFKKSNKGESLFSLKSFVPELMDTFLVSGEDGKRFRVLVFPKINGYVSLTEIKKEFPDGLDPRDASWIFRRILAQAVAASMTGVVHGSIVPDHVFVHPTTHDPLHLGWAHSVNNISGMPVKIEHVIDRWKDWYPPEVFKKKEIDSSLDIFMAGKTMIWLLGGDPKTNIISDIVPKEISNIVLSCTSSEARKRPKNAYTVLTDFTSVIVKLWGRNYRPLVLKGRKS